MADNNYCACNSGESKYTIKLNQQGPAGKKGEQGDKGIPGFSPYISVVQSDDENYILRINNEANSYNTPNLFPKDQVTTWTNNIEAQVQQLQAGMDTKANLTLDNINVANPFNLNGLYINTDPVKKLVRIGDRYAQNIRVSYDGLNISNDDYYNIDISNTSGITVQHKNNKTVLFSLTNEAFEYKNETIATQPWVEKQLDGFLTDLPAATETKLGAVKVQPLYEIDTSKMPEVVIGNNSKDSNTYQKLYVDDVLLPTNGVAVVEEGSNNSRFIAKAYLKAKIENNEASIEGYSLESELQKYNPKTNSWITVGNQISTIPLVATTQRAGFVKPDGTTVTITDDGTISAVGEVSQQELVDGLALKVNLTDYNNRVGSLESTVGEQAQTIATLQENNTRLLEMINTLKDRVTALETMIDGGNA